MQQIFNTIYQTAYLYGTNDKIIFITFDNVSNNNSTIRLLKDSLHLILNKNLLHIRCACHILSLSVQSIMGMVQDIIIKFRNTVFFIHTSKARLQKFKQISIDHGRYFKKFKFNIVTY